MNVSIPFIAAHNKHTPIADHSRINKTKIKKNPEQKYILEMGEQCAVDVFEGLDDLGALDFVPF